MEILTGIKETKQLIKLKKELGMKVGFVPTMGYLHEGHLSLIEQAKKENDFVVVSIFVNPTQFGQGEDFDRYPRDLERDVQLAEKAGANMIFAPEVREMYPTGYQTYVEVENATKYLCGKSRPGHFRGVTTVVNKLFNIINPDKAYFGQKDAQQTIVIKKMVNDLNMDTEAIVCPIIRESDGLAMSSRNFYLNQEERNQALVLNRSLQIAKDSINKGEKSARVIKEQIIHLINEQPLANIDYVEIVSGETLEEVDEIKGNIFIALAVKFGQTRLIDNIMMEVTQ